jgi:hypothetical protein
MIAQGLDPAAGHVIEIRPLLTAGQELRIESICVAGAPAVVLSDRSDESGSNGDRAV